MGRSPATGSATCERRAAIPLPASTRREARSATRGMARMPALQARGEIEVSKTADASALDLGRQPLLPASSHASTLNARIAASTSKPVKSKSPGTGGSARRRIRRPLATPAGSTCLLFAMPSGQQAEPVRRRETRQASTTPPRAMPTRLIEAGRHTRSGCLGSVLPFRAGAREAGVVPLPPNQRNSVLPRSDAKSASSTIDATPGNGSARSAWTTTWNPAVRLKPRTSGAAGSSRVITKTSPTPRRRPGESSATSSVRQIRAGRAPTTLAASSQRGSSRSSRGRGRERNQGNALHQGRPGPDQPGPLGNPGFQGRSDLAAQCRPEPRTVGFNHSQQAESQESRWNHGRSDHQARGQQAATRFPLAQGFDPG